jgi:hypothetical protein
MRNILHPNPYTGLESCEVCWADENETEIFFHNGIPYCEQCLDRDLEEGEE